MGANKYEAFETAVIDRGEIHEAYYNPRKISDKAIAKLKKFIKSKQGGLWCPLTWNRRTGNLVSGHQRLAVLDTLHKGKPYQLTVAVVDVSEREEVKGNVFMNNPAAMGEWDVDRLHEIADIFPDLKFDDDLGFDPEELDILGFDIGTDQLIDKMEQDQPLEQPSSENSTEEFRRAKQAGRDRAQKDNANGDGYDYSHTDFTVTFIFTDQAAKQSFLTQIGRPPTATRLNSQILYEIMDKKAPE